MIILIPESAGKTKKLWNACYTGDIDQVKELTADRDVNLNWRKPDMSVSKLSLLNYIMILTIIITAWNFNVCVES